MKKIVIFGATGQTGLCAVEAALQAGLTTRVFTRNLARLPERFRDAVEIHTGDVTVESDVQKAVEGQDGVVVALGTGMDLSPTTVLSDGLKNIIKAMQNSNMERISVCISAFLFFDPEKVPPRFHPITEDHRRMFKCLKESNLKWTAVFPPHIADIPLTGKYTVKYDESPGRVVSKYDLGDFLVKCLSMPEHINRVCGITSPQE